MYAFSEDLRVPLAEPPFEFVYELELRGCHLDEAIEGGGGLEPVSRGGATDPPDPPHDYIPTTCTFQTF